MLRKLFTHEDKFMLHKCFGILSLCNFLLSMYNLSTTENYLLFPWMNNLYMSYILFTHSILHITSFQFLLSDRRNRKYNIIWPEMRIHSMIFTYRSIMSIYVLYSQVQYAPLWRYLIVIATMALADITTYKYTQSSVSRTMRDNPYPDGTDPIVIKYVNGFYSVSQVFATMHILFAPNYEYIYLTLIPIQIAPFLMTLQRKGFINQLTWHIIYFLTVIINYSYSAIHIYDPVKMYAFVICFVYLRFVRRCNKYILWTLVYMLYNLLK